jgi:hypothetical protein
MLQYLLAQAEWDLGRICASVAAANQKMKPLLAE